MVTLPDILKIVMQCTLDVILTTANFKSAHEKVKAEERGKRKLYDESVQRRVPELFSSDWSRVIADVEEEKF